MNHYEDQSLGIGSYVGEVRKGSHGNLYQWEEGVDGIGNPIGFWRAIGKAAGAVSRATGVKLPSVRQLLPTAASFIPGAGPAVAAGVRAAQSRGLLGLEEGDFIGEVREGPDGNLYQWEEGVDGLGNLIGFWRAIGKAAGAVSRATGVKLPTVRQLLPAAAGFIPGVGPAVAAGLRAAQSSGFLRRR